MGDVIGKQRRVIGMLAGANANLALPLCIRQIFIVEGGEIDILRRVENAGAHGKREPMALGVAKFSRDGLRESLGFNCLGDALFSEINEVARIHRHQNVGRRACAFAQNALRKTVLQEHGVDLDAARSGEGFQQGLDQARFAGSVDVEFSSAGRSGRKGNRAGKQGKSRKFRHVLSPSPIAAI
ncbi:hypothetical protein D3C71_985950 [compost metagenome]